ncbi:MAG: GNAT family N-acetyltransferase [Hyphomicrobiales bacterium]|nr:GNAT family N-acetyltransferase [Hyphomicrobiales bacterium]
MTESAVSIRSLSGEEAHAHNLALCDVLMDCVEGGASVGFMSPLSQARAQSFWRLVAEDVATGRRKLLIAEDSATKAMLGTVHLVLAQPDNQAHRADVSKMLVHRKARRRGIGASLIREAEHAARELGKTLLVLDTVTGSDAERLYARLGWTKVGVIPDFALWPDGRACATTYFYKPLS